LLTFEQIKELIELVAERQLHGLEVERAGFRLKIDGQGPPVRMVMAGETSASSGASGSSGSYAPPAQALHPAYGASASDAASGVAGTGGAPGADTSGPPAGSHVLTSPIVGTFYRASSPDSAPFVEVGSRVKQGQVLCIIEAMKLMNEIESDVDGVILEIYPKNAQAVEFGEPLFAIRQD
jgi:acetyl-CoA carboxylase biotin carboxyl carrier protein